MTFQLIFSLFNILFLVLSFLIAIIAHEYSHGWVAEKLGDPTARMAGRLSFNPIVHIDPAGSIIVPIMILIMSGGTMMFGWAKPVPVNYYNLNNPQKDMPKVAFAGAAANFSIATCAALLLRFGGILPFEIVTLVRAGYASSMNPFLVFLAYLIFINLLLGIFNLIPIPPLDGSQILQAYLPRDLAWQYKKIEPYGFMIVVVLFFFLNGFGLVIAPLIEFILKLYSIH